MFKRNRTIPYLIIGICQLFSDIYFFIHNLKNTFCRSFTGNQLHSRHIQHHQLHHDLVNIAHESGKLSGRQPFTDHHMPTKPSYCQNAAINRQFHHQAIKRDNSLRFSLCIPYIFGRIHKFIDFIIAPDKRLNHPNTNQVFLYISIKFIKLRHHNQENRMCIFEYQKEGNSKRRNCCQQNQSQ